MIKGVQKRSFEVIQWSNVTTKGHLRSLTGQKWPQKVIWGQMTHIKPYPSPRPTSLIALTLNSNSFPMIKFWTFAWQWRTLSNATYHSPSGPDFLSLFSTWYPISSQLPSSFGAFHLRRAAVPMTSSMTKDRTLLFNGSYFGPWCTDTCSESHSTRASHASAVRGGPFFGPKKCLEELIATWSLASKIRFRSTKFFFEILSGSKSVFRSKSITWE